MAQRKVIWTQRAKDELKETLRFYKERNGSNRYSLRIKREVDSCVSLLLRYPEIGHPGINDSAKVWSFLTFGLIYEFDDRYIYVLSLWDFRRNPDDRPESLG